MQKTMEQEKVFHGDITKDFRSVELFAFIRCFSCGGKKGPLPTKYNREFSHEMECQIAEDAGFLNGLVSGNEEEDNMRMEYMCAPCIARFDIPCANLVFKPLASKE